MVAVSILGATSTLVALSLAALLTFASTSSWLGLVVVLVALGVISVGTFTARSVIGSVSRMVAAHNIVATRGEPRMWLVAHSDSKGQHLSLAGRIVALCVSVVGLSFLMASVTMLPFASPPLWLVFVAAVSATLGGISLLLDPVRNDSPGAVDNASGVIAALVAAEILRDRNDIGVLITDAEEYGMEGAREWVARHKPDGYFINFDGLDSRGQHRVMIHSGQRWTTRESARCVAEAAAAALLSCGLDAQIRRLPPGVFVDGAVLARAGMVGVTLSRGDFVTLRVVHTSRDTADRVDIAACCTIGEAAARAVGKLLS